MVKVRPFRNIQYNKGKIDSMEKVITQPYDKIPDELQEKYYKNSPYNYCRLILPREEDRYEAASTSLQKWMEEEILLKDKEPSIYVYYQRFEVLGKKHTRKGFISAVKLHPFEEKVVLPHEKTHKGPKIDRLNMLRATDKNLEPGFMLYSDADGTTIDIFDEIAAREPDFEAEDEYGVHSRVWRLSEERAIEKVQEVLDGQQVVIADGHHRYETAVTHRDEMREKYPDHTEDHAFNWRMTYMVPVEDPGLVVLPGHRLLLKHDVSSDHLEQIREHFDATELEIGDAESYLEEHKDKISFVMYDGDKAVGISIPDLSSVEKFMDSDYSEDYRSLDVVILRDVIFEGIMGAKELAIDETIAYERWLDDAVKRVKEGDATVAFLVNATRPEQVLRTAKNGERMPEKSTDFYPKVNSGFTMMDIGPEEKLL